MQKFSEDKNKLNNNSSIYIESSTHNIQPVLVAYNSG